MEHTAAVHLPRDAVLALSSVIWATGVVVPAGAAALLEAARESGLRDDDLLAVERATGVPPRRTDVASLALDAAQRLFAYGLATWLARANDTLVRAEMQALADLGDRLGLSHDERARAAAAAHAIADPALLVPDHDVMALARALRGNGASVP
jgi:hypothetical protein